jgi:(2Fe-2S) ferredoxin
MEKPKHHILVCASFRVKGEAQGACNRKGSTSLLPLIEEALSESGLENVMVSTTGCLKACEHGPVLIVYPEGWWYGGVTEDAVTDIIEALAQGKPVANYLI